MVFGEINFMKEFIPMPWRGVEEKDLNMLLRITEAIKAIKEKGEYNSVLVACFNKEEAKRLTIALTPEQRKLVKFSWNEVRGDQIVRIEESIQEAL